VTTAVSDVGRATEVEERSKRGGGEEVEERSSER
jgi:hypothetical protein